jgi:hypothetical protein
MAFAECLWCETQVRPNAKVCRQCGLQSPAGKPNVESKVVRRGLRVVLALFLIPLMLSAAYAARIGAFPLVSGQPETQTVAIADPMPTPSFASPLQKAVWTDGVRAVRQVLGQPAYVGFQNSFVSLSTGNIVSLCGQLSGTSGYDGTTGERRFISVFGQSASTTLDGADPSFGVLWNRVCSGQTSPA